MQLLPHNQIVCFSHPMGHDQNNIIAMTIFEIPPLSCSDMTNPTREDLPTLIPLWSLSLPSLGHSYGFAAPVPWSTQHYLITLVNAQNAYTFIFTDSLSPRIIHRKLPSGFSPPNGRLRYNIGHSRGICSPLRGNGPVRTYTWKRSETPVSTGDVTEDSNPTYSQFEERRVGMFDEFSGRMFWMLSGSLEAWQF